MKKISVLLVLLLAAVLVLSACSAKVLQYGFADQNMYGGLEADSIETNYDPEARKIIENKFEKTSENPISTFSADVDTASYALLRRMIKSGYTLDELLSTAAYLVRTEELVNYFKYDYKRPENGELFGLQAKLVDCPWNSENGLLILGLQTEVPEKKLANNLVFLIDVSGSMSDSDKLPLLQKTFSYLLSGLGADDTVSIVTYASGEEVILEGCSGSKPEMIQNAIDKLKAQGSTNGEAGMKRAYELAEKYYKPDGNNRIIMASDGDLNVGISTVDGIKEFVAEKRDQGVYLSVLGFGFGNYRDSMMETIADSGNGVYYYIDGEEEAEKVFGTDILSTLYTVASDVKLQVTFDPETVSEYRLIGYENRIMKAEDFDDETKDAGEIGAGRSVTVCYELKLEPEAQEDRLFDLSVKYKKPGDETSTLNEYSFLKSQIKADPDKDTDLIAALCELAMILHKSEYGPNLTIDDVFSLIKDHDYSSDGYKQQFVSYIKELKERKK